MAIEKMVMINMVGHMDDIDRVSKFAVLSKSFQPVNALQEINSTDFTLTTTENNMEAIIDVCYIRPYSNNRDYTDMNSKMNELKKMSYCSKKCILDEQEIYLDYNTMIKNLDMLYDKFKDINDKYKDKIGLKEKIERSINSLSHIKDINIPMQELTQLKNFSCEIFKVSKENMIKLKENYENIPSIIIKTSVNNEYTTVIAFTPNVLETESQRIFKSLNFEKVKLSFEYKSTPQEEINKLKNELASVNDEIKKIKNEIDRLSKENEKEIYVTKKSVQLENKSAEIKNEIACTNEFFYLCGWIPKSLLSNLRKKMKDIENKIIIIEKNPESIENTNIKPPTKLKNNAIVKPFEAMVAMYGIPSYNEIDPTTFLGITYMIMFGAMFGDLGQGCIFFLLGLFLKYKKRRPNFGGVLSRLGISSSIFGILYGSFFGFEDVIPALFIRPMENISQILLYAIVFGCALLILGFVYSLINNIKRRDIENGLFGNNGAAGMAFYLLVLIFAYTKLKNIETMPAGVWTFLLIALLVIILLKEPLANLVRGKRPFLSGSKGDYFVENGFGVAETILSLFSNTLSFIRVGAFALNHVGLFVAFAALAKMMNSGFMSVTMYILGNLIILGLEGLIVFIQGLRLEYYELFSKYYEGEGNAFEPIKLSDNYSLN